MRHGINPESVREHLLAKPGADEGLPFGPDALVFKVAGKMFAILALERHPTWLTLKCDPDRALELRERYAAIRPGYHTNKRHWNTLTLDGSLPATLVAELMDHSYELVVRGLPRRVRAELEHTGS